MKTKNKLIILLIGLKTIFLSCDLDNKTNTSSTEFVVLKDSTGNVLGSYYTIDGKFHGRYLKLYKNGNKQEVIKYNMGKAEQKEYYYPNGNLKQRKTYVYSEIDSSLVINEILSYKENNEIDEKTSHFLKIKSNHECLTFDAIISDVIVPSVDSSFLVLKYGQNLDTISSNNFKSYFYCFEEYFSGNVDVLFIVISKSFGEIPKKYGGGEGWKEEYYTIRKEVFF